MLLQERAGVEQGTINSSEIDENLFLGMEVS